MLSEEDPRTAGSYVTTFQISEFFLLSDTDVSFTTRYKSHKQNSWQITCYGRRALLAYTLQKAVVRIRCLRPTHTAKKRKASFPGEGKGKGIVINLYSSLPSPFNTCKL